jgi:hypothetical protein
MNRSFLMLATFLMVTVFLVTIFFLGLPGSNIPRFIPMHSRPVGSYSGMDYDWGGNSPLRDKVWIDVSSTNGDTHHCFWYDVPNHLLAGELLHASRGLFNRDQTKLLCSGTSLNVTWKFKLLGLIYKLPVKTAKDFAQKTFRSMIPPNEVLYILNLVTVQVLEAKNTWSYGVTQG